MTTPNSIEGGVGLTGRMVCAQADHRYEPGPYNVCRRCGGERPSPSSRVRAALATQPKANPDV